MNRNKKVINEIKNLLEKIIKNTTIDFDDIRKLEVILKDVPEYISVYGKIYIIGNSEFQFNPDTLVQWLIYRSQSSSPTKALKDLDEFIKNKKIELFDIAFLDSLHIEEEYEFCNGVQLIKASSINFSQKISNEVQKNNIAFLSPTFVDSVLVYKWTQEIEFKSDETSMPPRIPLINEEIEDARLCLDIARGPQYGVHIFSSSRVPHDSVPSHLGMGKYSTPSYKPPNLSPPLIPLTCRKADSLLKKWNNLTQETRGKLRITLQRYSDFSSGQPWIDRLIDLRVCIESLFAKDNENELLTYKISLRAALFLGKTFEEKNKIRDTVKTAYDLSSKVLHGGKMPSKLKPKQDQAIDDMGKYIPEVILKIFDMGKMPDWSTIELMGAD